MAKQPSKKSAARDDSADIDRLALSLLELAAFDQASTTAMTALGYVLQVPIELPDITTCEFDLDGTHYSAQVTSHQSNVILEAVVNTPNQQDVQEAVNILFGALALEVTTAFNSLGNQLADPKISPSGGQPPKVPLVNNATIGCCVYDGGKVPNITQSVCDLYHPKSWGPPADCATIPPQSPKRK
jgi:hypothetical protein